MISEENVKMGNKALADEAEAMGLDRSSLQRMVDSLNLRRLGDQALVLRDKMQQNPKATAGIALAAVAGGIWAISRSVSASRRRQRTATKLLAAIGLWRILAPAVKSLRRKTPKLKKTATSRLADAGELLRHNAGPFFEHTIPKLVKRFSH